MPEIGNRVGLYFHIPFCSKKCPYCHFYVLPDQDSLKILLLDGLKQEWAFRRSALENQTPYSVYFGGGTPYLLGSSAIKTILSWIPSRNLAEITLEANPENVTDETMKAYADAGINRISIGVQSLDDSSLNVLGRRHSAQRAIEAIESAKRAGIANISIDLMYDLPHQTLESWERTLKQVRDLPITHVSLYNLTFEPQTVFFKRQKSLKPHVPTEELSLILLQKALGALDEMGLKRYEISAFAKPGFEAVHNKGYWEGRPFLGFGPSAFSFWEGKRFRNIADLSKYCALLGLGQTPVDFEETLPYPANILELLAVRLRLTEGVDLQTFSLPESTTSTLQKLQECGWVTVSGSRAKLTEAGLLFYDSVAEALID